jgi:L-amino acid N-acyltransferase YncA
MFGDDGRVLVRLATANDGGQLRDVYGPYIEQTAISFEIEVPTAAEMARRVAVTLPRHPWLVAEEAGTVVGYAYAHQFAERAAYRWSVETSAYVGTEVRGRGVGPRLYSSLLALVAYQGYREAFAGITLPNPASVSFHEKMGFQQVGVYRRSAGRWDPRTMSDGGSEGSAPPMRTHHRNRRASRKYGRTPSRPCSPPNGSHEPSEPHRPSEPTGPTTPPDPRPHRTHDPTGPTTPPDPRPHRPYDPAGHTSPQALRPGRPYDSDRGAAKVDEVPGGVPGGHPLD